MRLAVIGATGLVGREMVKVLEEMNLPVSELILAASPNSYEKTLPYKGVAHKVMSIADALSLQPSIALFSAGSDVSKEWSPQFAKASTTVIDNSSYWRMYKDVPLIVPEVNASILSAKNKIIANPNCSTIQLVVALSPLHDQYKIKRIVASTYQSVSGTGAKGVLQLENERKGVKGEMAYPHSIDLNIIPHGGNFLDNGYTTEEIKLIEETKKILSDQSIRVTCTVVRVPVFVSHCESVNIEFEKDFDIEEIRNILSHKPGIIVEDDIKKNSYPMPKYVDGKNEVFIGRIRRDDSQAKSLNLWIVADNLRKGAATNAVQIAQYLINKKLVTL